MTWADDVFGDNFLGRLWEEQDAGYVRTQCHPEDPCLKIWNYTEKAVFDKHWNDVTLNTRGLITYLHDGLELAIEARPFKKFFNYGEVSAPEFSLGDEVEVTDKMDGSLGIGYFAPDGRPAVATRGSFESDQAAHATKLLRSKESYERWAKAVMDKGWTPMWEIVYPENRIVVDYEGMDDLVYLGIRGNQSGVSHVWNFAWPGPRTQVFDYCTFAEALHAPPRPGKEGLVVRMTGTEHRVKIKQEDYILLHRVVTNLNERAVWEVVKDRSQNTWAWIAELPDEFHDWAKQVAHDLRQQFKEIADRISLEWDHLMHDCYPEDWKQNRKRFAEYALKTPYPWALFSRLDGKDYSAKIWDMIKPEAHKTPHGRKVQDDES